MRSRRCPTLGNPVLGWLSLPRIPDDLKKSFTARITEAGSFQPEILRFIQATTGAWGATVAQSDLEHHFKKDPPEMYYRLEQLRLLGFITKEHGTGNDFGYRLSQDYRRELGLPEIVVNLSLVSPRGRTSPFGNSTDTPPSHFYYVRASNCRTSRIRKARILLTRVRILDDTGSTVDDYQEIVQLKWQAATNRCVPRDINAREDSVANVGFIIKGYDYFQLDICADPWPQGFPGRLDPRRRIGAGSCRRSCSRWIVARHRLGRHVERRQRPNGNAFGDQDRQRSMTEHGDDGTAVQRVAPGEWRYATQRSTELGETTRHSGRRRCPPRAHAGTSKAR